MASGLRRRRFCSQVPEASAIELCVALRGQSNACSAVRSRREERLWLPPYKSLAENYRLGAVANSLGGAPLGPDLALMRSAGYAGLRSGCWSQAAHEETRPFGPEPTRAGCSRPPRAVSVAARRRPAFQPCGMPCRAQGSMPIGRPTNRRPCTRCADGVFVLNRSRLTTAAVGTPPYRRLSTRCADSVSFPNRSRVSFLNRLRPTIAACPRRLAISPSLVVPARDGRPHRHQARNRACM